MTDSQTDSANEAMEESTRLPLPLVIIWGLSPAILMVMSGLCMEWHLPEIVSGSLLILGLEGGLVILGLWSARFFWSKDLGDGEKIVGVLVLTVFAWTVNVVLAVGACDIFKPPYEMPH